MDLHAWATAAVSEISSYLREDAYWADRMRTGSFGLHLGVFVEPFLSLMLSGEKDIESRFSTRRCAPFDRVAARDLLLIKSASGPVVGICEVAKAWHFDLNATPIKTIRERFGAGICGDDAFWRSRAEADYATILRVRKVRTLPPLSCPKRDRRGWVVFSSPFDAQLALPVCR